MNAQQQAKFAMYRVIENVCDSNTAVTAAVPAFQHSLTAFKTLIVSIADTARLKNLALTGVAADKSNFKQTLCETAADICGIIFAFASATSNHTLREEVRNSLTTLLKTRDELLIARCLMIRERAESNLASLADYGITPAKLTRLQTAIDNFSNSNVKPRTAFINRKTMTANLITLFKDADAILKDRMDNLVRNFKETDFHFFDTYFAARQIVNPSTTTTQLKGRVTDAADGTPIKDALITILELAKTAVTDSSGEYLFKPVFNGQYEVTAAAAGFQIFEVDKVKIKMGEINHFDMQIRKK